LENGTLVDYPLLERGAVVCRKGNIWLTLHISLFTSKEWRRGISGGRTILGDDYISVTLIFHGKRLMVDVCGA
jgi:hypothetical protein